MAQNYRADREDQLPAVAAALASELASRLVLLEGPMGAGKTALVKALCKFWKVEDAVTSPTYSLVQEYFSPVVGTIYHFDWYRIEEEAEALDLGLDDYLESGAFCLMEWPAKIRNLLPREFDQITIQLKGPTRLFQHQIQRL